MKAELRRQIRKAFIKPLETRIRQIVRRAVVKVVVDDGLYQEIQVEFLGQLRKALVMQPYGFASKPHPDSEAILAALGGSPSKLLALVVGDRRYRFKVDADGEVAVYDDLGSVVHFKRGGLHVKSSSGTTTIDDNLHVAGKITSVGNVESGAKVTSVGDMESGAKVTAAANVEAGAEVQDSVGMLSALRTWAATHVHTGSPTAPVGVVSPTGLPTTTP